MDEIPQYYIKEKYLSSNLRKILTYLNCGYLNIKLEFKQSIILRLCTLSVAVDFFFDCNFSHIHAKGKRKRRRSLLPNCISYNRPFVSIISRSDENDEQWKYISYDNCRDWLGFGSFNFLSPSYFLACLVILLTVRYDGLTPGPIDTVTKRQSYRLLLSSAKATLTPNHCACIKTLD